MESDNRKSGVKRKRTNLSITEKLTILQELDNKVPITTIVKKYDVSERTVRLWKFKRLELEKTKSTYDLSSNPKRIRITPFDQLGEILYIWFAKCSKSGIPLTGPLIMEKARELHAELGIQNKFNASVGWLDHWKKIYKIKYYSLCGEKLSANVSTTESYTEFINNLMKEEQLLPSQIFNADETGLYFKAMPIKNAAEKSQNSPAGFKQIKERVTVMLCCNADATLKLPLMVIGKSAKPRAIKNMSQSSLPVNYMHHKSAWMTSDIFENWFKNKFVPDVEKFLEERKLPKKAVLLLDNAPYHPSSNDLSVDDIKVRYWPPNTTTLIQPLDQGIIENFKRHYKSLFLQNVLFAESNGINVIEYLKTVNIKNVIYWVNESWNNVPATTISNCWEKLFGKEVDDLDLQGITNKEIVDKVQRVSEYQNIEEQAVEEWINSSDLSHIPSNAELVSLMRDQDEEEEADNDDVPTKTMTAQNAVSAAETLINFYEENQLLTASDLVVLQKIKEKAIQLSNSYF